MSIKTSDGATINAVLVRPKADGKPIPALLEFTIYANSPNYAKECAAHGYAGIVAYTRETPDSYYRVAPFKTDGEDARAVIDWIARQPWSDGRVGMYGGSYSGFTQWAAAKRLPAALKAIAASSPNAPGVDFPMRGGIFRNSAYRWSYNVTNKKGWDDTYNDKRWRVAGRDLVPERQGLLRVRPHRRQAQSVFSYLAAPSELRWVLATADSRCRARWRASTSPY